MAEKDRDGETGAYIPPNNTATVQRSRTDRYSRAASTVACGETSPNVSPTPDGCTLEAYAGAKGLPIDFLRSLGLRTIHYVDRKAVKIPYLDEEGSEVCVRFRVSLRGRPKIKTRKGDKHRLYGLWRLEEAQRAGVVLVVEGESDAQTAWYHNRPAVGVPGASSFRDEWAEDLDGIERVYAVVEPDAGGEALWEKLASSPLQERLYRVELNGHKDISELHLSGEDVSKHLDQALSYATAWRDIAESEAQERTRDAWTACETLARSEDILKEFASDLAQAWVVGESRAAKLLYLSLTTRFFDRTVNLVIKGPSSGGKSFLVEKVLGFFPEDAFYALTGMSERALVYDDEPISHRFLVIYEAAGLKGEFLTYTIRSLLSEARLRYTTVEKTSEGLRPCTIERQGPTGLILTTTATRIHA